jgi:DNA polymerase III subunit epsilon
MGLSGWLSRRAHSPRWTDVVFWALDLETTGLRPESDRILSVGMVPIRTGVIRYGERFHSLVRPATGEGLSTDGIRAHHLRPTDLEAAPPLAAVLPEIDRRLREGVLLLHFAQLDLAFLRGGYRRTGREWPKPHVVDTVDLILRLHERQQRWTPHPTTPRTGLAETRRVLGLPPYPSHDALSDALATAELFLLLRSRLELDTLRGIH